MINEVFQVDESVERALREERSLGGKHDLMQDLVRGNHARAVISEMNHLNALKAAGEQIVNSKDDFEFRLEAILPAAGFHHVGLQESYEAWDEGSDYLDYIKRKFPENRIKERSSRCMVTVGSKYGPPKL